MTMIQYDAHGRFVRKAKYNSTIFTIWYKQIPFGKIIVL